MRPGINRQWPPTGFWTPGDVLGYGSRRPGRRTAAGTRPDLAAVAVRLAATTAAVVMLGCLMVAVPCVVFAAVGVWFDDASAADAGLTGAVAAVAAVAAAVPIVLCDRYLCRGRRALGLVDWN